MKKHELLKKAFTDYPEGTIFLQIASKEEIQSSGKFSISEGFGCFGIVDDYNQNGVYDSSKNTWAEIVKPKIAIKVENEKEFKALEIYLNVEHNDSVEFPCYVYPDEIKKYIEWVPEDVDQKYIKDYQIIPFKEFAKEKGIKVPLLTSEDGVELFNGDYGATVVIENKTIGNPFWKVNIPEDGLKTDKYKYFSTKQAAIDWIEAQKPKDILVDLFDKNTVAQVTPDGIFFKWKKTMGTHSVYMISHSDVEDIKDAINQLNNSK